MDTFTITYQDEETVLEGFVAYSSQEKRPLVILCHSWSGRDTYICEKAELIATWGYVCFALDMYGKGILGRSKEENGALKQPFMQDRHLLQRRLLKAYEVASKLPSVDPRYIASVGFGFGGLCALDFARTGVDLKGIAIVYGHFDDLPSTVSGKPLRAKVLLLHGYEDKIAPLSELLAFQKKMSEAKVDLQTHIYSHTMHAFMNPNANDPALGTVYNPLSAKRSLQSIKNFLVEIFDKEN